LIGSIAIYIVLVNDTSQLSFVLAGFFPALNAFFLILQAIALVWIDEPVPTGADNETLESHSHRHMRDVIGVSASFVAGILCLALNQLIFSPEFPPPGEYYWMLLVQQNSTAFSYVLMVISGFLIAFRTGGNPLFIGFGAMAISPVATFPLILGGATICLKCSLPPLTVSPS